MSRVKELERALEEARKKESNDNHLKFHKEIVDFFNPLINKTIGYASIRKNVIEHINVIRINEIEADKHYLEQGAYGQFSSKRWIDVKGTCLTIGSKYVKDSHVYSTRDGDIFISDEYGLNTPPELSNMINGLPIGIKKNWKKEFERIVDCGTYAVNNCIFKFGDKDVMREDCNTMYENFQNFKRIYKLFPDEVFDRIINLHVKHCKETYDLMNSFKNIELKDF